MNALASFLKDENGATAIEYGLIASIVVLGIIVGAKSIGTKLQTTFTDIAGNFSS